MLNQTSVDCYQCKKSGVVSRSKWFPFCCKVCKEKWGLENRAGNRKNRQKYKTIAECQKRIKKWRSTFRTIEREPDPVVEEKEDLVLF